MSELLNNNNRKVGPIFWVQTARYVPGLSTIQFNDGQVFLLTDALAEEAPIGAPWSSITLGGAAGGFTQARIGTDPKIAFPGVKELSFQTAIGGNLPNAVAAGVTGSFQSLLDGSSYVSALIVVGSGFSGTIVPQISVDELQTNWLSPFAPGSVAPMGCAYVKRIDVVTANPLVTPFISVPGTYELIVPSCCTAIRANVTVGSASAFALQVTPGRAYVGGAEETCTFFDMTSAVNTAIGPGTFEMDGWSGYTAFIFVPAGGSANIQNVDDTGAALSNAINPVTVTGLVSSVTRNGPTGGGQTLVSWLKRLNFFSVGVAGLTSRVRWENRR